MPLWLRESETTIKIKFALFRGGGQGGREENCPKRYFFRGKRHDNKILKVKMLLSRIFVVMAQAPNGNQYYKSKTTRKGAPAWHLSSLFIASRSKKQAIVCAISSAKQGKRVCTTGPERLYTIEANSKNRKRGRQTGVRQSSPYRR